MIITRNILSDVAMVDVRENYGAEGVGVVLTVAMYLYEKKDLRDYVRNIPNVRAFVNGPCENDSRVSSEKILDILRSTSIFHFGSDERGEYFELADSGLIFGVRKMKGQDGEADNKSEVENSPVNVAETSSADSTDRYINNRAGGRPGSRARNSYSYSNSKNDRQKKKNKKSSSTAVSGGKLKYDDAAKSTEMKVSATADQSSDNGKIYRMAIGQKEQEEQEKILKDKIDSVFSDRQWLKMIQDVNRLLVYSSRDVRRACKEWFKARIVKVQVMSQSVRELKMYFNNLTEIDELRPRRSRQQLVRYLENELQFNPTLAVAV